jgi:hypothetical protein
MCSGGLATQLPLKGKGFNMDYRTIELPLQFDIMKRKAPDVFYDHRTARFASLDN